MSTITFDTFNSALATKVDVSRLEKRMDSLDSKVERLDSKIEAMELRLTIKLGTFLAVAVGVLIAVLKTH